MAATEGDTVRIHYTGRLDDGTVFDSSEGRDPLEFKLGTGQVIKGFDDAVQGMEAGDRKTVTVPFVDAYGPHRQEFVIDVQRGELPAGLDPEVGQQLQMTTKDGNAFPVRVAETAEDSIRLDANHPLAGQDLTFELHLVDVT